MKLSNFKKGLLTLAAVLTCSYASADTVLKENFAPNGTTFTLETDIDFTTQSLEVVVDLSTCGYYASQDILSVGENESVMASGYSSSNAVHCLYTPNSTELQTGYYGSTRVVATNSSVSKDEHTLLLSKDGLFLDGELITATYNPYTGGAASFDSDKLSELLALKHIYIGSTFASYGSYSYATYKSIKILGDAGGTEPDPEPAAQPESIPFDLTAQNGWTATGEKFAWNTDIDFTKQYLQVVINFDSCDVDKENVLSVGEAIDAWNGNHIHFYYYPTEQKMQLTYKGGNQYKNYKTGITGIDTLVFSREGVLLNGELWEGATSDGYGSYDKADSTTIKPLLALTNISVGSQEGTVRSHANYLSVQLIDYPEDPEPPVTGPETIQIPLTEAYTPNAEHNNQFVGTTGIDWDTQSLSVALEITNATSYGTEALISIGEDISSKTGEAAGNIHVGVNPGFGVVAVNYYNNTNTDSYVANGSAMLGTSTAITFNLSKANGLTAQVGTADATEVLSADVLAPLFEAGTIQVGSLLSTELNYAVATSKVNSITLNTVETPKEEVTMPESIPFDLTEKGGWVANGETFGWDSDIDFTKQSLEVVLNLNSCTGTNENVISFASAEDELPSWNNPVSDAGHLHFYYTKSSKAMELDYLNTDGNTYRNVNYSYFGNETDTITICKDGVKVNGEVWQGASQNGSATACDSTAIINFLKISHVWVGSKQGDNRSHATYLSVKILDNEPEVVVTPDTIQIPLTEAYTPSAEHNNQYIGGTKINFEEQTLKVALDLTNCGTEDQAVITIGESVSDLYAPTAGNIHVGYSPEERSVVAYYLTTEADEEGGGQAEIELGTATKVIFELSKENGLTAQLGTDEATTLFSAEAIAPIVALDSIEVGCIAAEGAFLGAAQATVDSILVKEIPPFVVTKPESIPFDLSEYGGWFADGDTFAWDSDIDWTKQALQIVLDLSTCTSVSNQNVVSIAGTEDDLAQWSASTAEGHVHWYYTKSSNNMEVDYLTTRGNIYRNSNTSLYRGTVENDTMLVSMDGVYVNGQQWTGAAEQTTSYTAFDATTIAPLTNLTHIWVGSTQGDGRSWATYKSIQLIDYNPAANAISGVDKANELNENAPMYNLAGQRVGKDYKGIVIVGGKKVLKK